MLKINKVKGFILMVSMLCFLGNTMAEDFPAKHDNNVSLQTGQVTGTVVDNIGPVIGAAVMIKGTTTGTVTNTDGQFTLNGVSNGAIIQISFIGYVTQEITYNGDRKSVV